MRNGRIRGFFLRKVLGIMLVSIGNRYLVLLFLAAGIATLFCHFRFFILVREQFKLDRFELLAAGFCFDDRRNIFCVKLRTKGEIKTSAFSILRQS